MKITIEAIINADIETVWQTWNSPADIMQWNAASADWHTTSSTVYLREGGSFCSRMEAKDGSMGFDFSGTYTRIIPQKLIEYVMSDERAVTTSFTREAGKVKVVTIFDADGEFDAALQRQGWQSILDNIVRHTESKKLARTQVS